MPVQAVIEHGGRHYCALHDQDGFQAHEVTIGPTNDKFVVIQAGLVAGQEVVLNAAAYREKLGLPELPPDHQRKSNGRDREPQSDPKSQREPGAEKDGEKPSEERSPAEVFKEMDKNGDGKLAGSELPAPFRAGIMAADTNGDGAIELAEFEASVERFRLPNPGGASNPGTRP